MQSVPNKPIMLSVIMLSVVALVLLLVQGTLSEGEGLVHLTS
jgi:hypothetical protein